MLSAPKAFHMERLESYAVTVQGLCRAALICSSNSMGDQMLHLHTSAADKSSAADKCTVWVCMMVLSACCCVFWGLTTCNSCALLAAEGVIQRPLSDHVNHEP